MQVHTVMRMRRGGGGVFSNIHGWGADHNVSNDQGPPSSCSKC